jgi:small subunit ribosomal protein S5
MSDTDYKSMMAEARVESLDFGDQENMHRLEKTLTGDKSFFDFKDRYDHGEELDFLHKYPPLADTMYEAEEYVPDGLSEKANASSLLANQGRGEDEEEEANQLSRGGEEDIGFAGMLKEEEDGKDDVWAYDDELLRESGINLRDERGTKWSVTVIDNRVTQKVVRGGYKMSHKAMVVVGNGRGVAGYGVGKGPEPEDALKKSLRNAMKNLHHIDLFQGTSLNHNLTGKHNSTRVFIQASKPESNMRASPLATVIMHAFGITSGIVKITGKRSPESNVKAMFRALMKHKSLESMARERGLKFLDLYHQRLWGFGMHDYHDCYARDVDAYDPRMGRLDASEQLETLYRVNQRVEEGVEDFSVPDAMVLNSEVESGLPHELIELSEEKKDSSSSSSFSRDDTSFFMLQMKEDDRLEELEDHLRPTVDPRLYGYDFDAVSTEWMEDRSDSLPLHSMNSTSSMTDEQQMELAEHYENLPEEEWKRQVAFSDLSSLSESRKNKKRKEEEGSVPTGSHTDSLSADELQREVLSAVYDKIVNSLPKTDGTSSSSGFASSDLAASDRLRELLELGSSTHPSGFDNQKDMEDYDQLRQQRLKKVWPLMRETEKEMVIREISREQRRRFSQPEMKGRSKRNNTTNNNNNRRGNNNNNNSSGNKDGQQ